MQIRVPLSDDRNHSLTMLVIYLPDGTQVKVKTGKPVYDFKLPAGVGEDEIDVYSIFLGQDQKPAYGCGPVCIKRATKVTVAEAAAEAAAEAGSPSIEATEPPAITPTHVETEAAALHTVTNHANDKHDAGTTTVSEPAAATSASAADVSAPAADAPVAAAAATPVAVADAVADAVATSEPAALAVEPATPAVEPAATVAGPGPESVSESAAHAPVVSATAAPVDVRPAKSTVKHTSNASIERFEPTYDPKHGRKS